MGYCLSPLLVEKFKKSLKSGEISPDSLEGVSSAERRKILEGIVGREDAPNVNALFESKLLLKNKKRGMITWAKKIAGLSPEAKRDIFSKIEKLDTVLDPKSEELFLNDLANKRLGISVTDKEAKQIFDLSKKVQELKPTIGKDFKFKNTQDRYNYGAAKATLDDYVKELKSKSQDLTKEDFKLSPTKSTIEAVSRVASATKSLNSSLDNSSIFRQGWKTMWTNPSMWRKNAAKTFETIRKELGGEDTMLALKADAFSRENMLNGYYKKAKLAVGITEEAYPSSFPEKIPGIKNLFKASENSYAGFLYAQRMDIFDKYIQIAKQTGVDLSDKELSSIGQMVNSLTGRGTFGAKAEKAMDTVNNIFFSPRLVKSHVDVLGGQVISGAGGSNFVRKEAAKNLLKIIAGTSSVLAVANAINPGSVETDPRSSDFGKIKIGNTRFDVSGGMGSVITLAARMIPTKNKNDWGLFSKSSTTGKVTEINSGKFGSKSRTDVIGSFLANKLSPTAAFIKTFANDENFKGEKPTLAGEGVKLVLPIGVQNLYENLNSNDPKAANALVQLIADGLGIGTNTYSKDDFKKGK